MQDAMNQAGMECPYIVEDGNIHRFGKSNNCWYISHGNYGAFGDWSAGISETWQQDKNLSDAEYKKLQKQIQETRKTRNQKLAKQHNNIACKANSLWNSILYNENITHPYLSKKQVKPYGIKLHNGKLHIPLMDIDGKIWSLQTIGDDGTKRFLTGGKKKGCFFSIGNINDSSEIFICEGYATGASIYEASNIPTIVTFDSGNLEPVILELQKRYPNKKITICGDNDLWGDKNIGKDIAVKLASKYNFSYIIPKFLENIYTNQPTDFNDLHVYVGLDEVKKQLKIQAPKQTYIPDNFFINKHGAFYRNPNSEKEAIKLCSPLEIIAHTSNENDNNHGVLLKWKSKRNLQEHQWAVPCKLLAGDGREIFERLLDEGLEISPNRLARNRLLEYIQSVQPNKKALSLSRIGWHNESFAFPDMIYPQGQNMILQSEHNNHNHFNQAGTLEEWQEHIGKYFSGNSRLILAVATALAAPLLKIVGEDSSFIHLMSGSSKGKTTTLKIASSIWGKADSYIKQWRITGNALEAVAESHNDCMLALDELGQVDGRMVGDIIYTIANNQGKGRMKSSTSLRQNKSWRILVLSTGELTMEEKIKEAGKNTYAGISVRCINIPEPQNAHGLFEELHGFTDGHNLSVYLREQTNKYYGVASRKFIEILTNDPYGLEQPIKEAQKQFIYNNVPNDSDSQVKRVASKMGLIAAAGELAISSRVLPLNSGDACDAVTKCFHDWLEQRGT